MMAKLMNKRTGQTIAENVIVAKTFSQRSKGLLGRTGFDQNSTMWFPRCNSIHTWFMKFAIDVVFVDSSLCVKAIHKNVGPWRLILPRWGWKDTFEFTAGAPGIQDLQRGDQLYVVD